MKLLILIISICAMTLTAQDTNRFQLLNVTLKDPDGKTQMVLFKFDTTTGQTWKYRDDIMSTGNKDYQTVKIDGWWEVTDYLENRKRAQEIITTVSTNNPNVQTKGTP